MSDYEVLEVEDKFELFWNVVSRLNWILLSSHGHTQRDLLSSDDSIFKYYIQIPNANVFLVKVDQSRIMKSHLFEL